MGKKPTRARKRSAAAAALPPKPAAPTFEAWRQSLTPAEQRIEDILDLMVGGAWLSGQTDKLLAKRWDVSPSYVRSLAAEANRILRREVREDPEFKAERKAQIVSLFSLITHRALRMNTPNGLRVALEGAKAQGLYLGLEPVKSTGPQAPSDEFDKMSDAELERYASEGPLDSAERAERAPGMH